MISRRRLLFAGLLLLALLAAAFAAKLYRRDHLKNPGTLTLLKPVGQRQSAQDAIKLIPIYPTDNTAAPVFKGNFWASPQLVRLPDRPPFLLLLDSSGMVAAIDPSTGRRLWQAQLGRPSEEEVFARTAPGQFGDRVMLVYQATNHTTGAVENRALVLRLRDGKQDTRFPPFVFDARVPAIGGGEARFDQALHMARAVSILPSQQGEDRAYITFSGTDETQPWHGWLFEVDLDRWKLGFANRAISAAFVPTPEANCKGTAELEEVCGGGMWAYEGAKIEVGASGPEILVQTSNGRLDLSRGDFAQALLRLSRGLKFSPQCDLQACAGTNPRDPSHECLSTCRNLFAPRLFPTESYNPPDPRCRGKSYRLCLELMDWDFGSGSPARIITAGHRYYATIGKAGDLFLVDGEVLGRMYDRKQVAPFCGTPSVPCPNWNSGLTITEPAVTTVNGQPMVIVTTFNEDAMHWAGAVAYRVVGAPAKPRLEEAWRVPDPGSTEARKWFRAAPTRPIVSTIRGEPIVWVADNAREGRILAIRVRDGKVLANVRTAGWPMRNARPVIFGDTFYLPAAVQGREDITWIEAYKIVTH
jgi:hypothetical protein